MAFLKKSHKNSYSPLEQVTALNTEQLTENESRGKTEILRSEMTFSRLALLKAKRCLKIRSSVPCAGVPGLGISCLKVIIER